MHPAGKIKWCFYTTSSPSEPGGDTWPDNGTDTVVAYVVEDILGGK